MRGRGRSARPVDGNLSLRCVVWKEFRLDKRSDGRASRPSFIVGNEWVGLAICAVEQGTVRYPVSTCDQGP